MDDTVENIPLSSPRGKNELFSLYRNRHSHLIHISQKLKKAPVSPLWVNTLCCINPVEPYLAIKSNEALRHTIGINFQNIMQRDRKPTRDYITYDSIFEKIQTDKTNLGQKNTGTKFGRWKGWGLTGEGHENFLGDEASAS